MNFRNLSHVAGLAFQGVIRMKLRVGHFLVVVGEGELPTECIQR